MSAVFGYLTFFVSCKTKTPGVADCPVPPEARYWFTVLHGSRVVQAAAALFADSSSQQTPLFREVSESAEAVSLFTLA